MEQPPITWNTAPPVEKPKSPKGIYFLTVCSFTFFLVLFWALMYSGSSVAGIGSVLGFFAVLACMASLVQKVLKEGVTPPRRSDRIYLEVHGSFALFVGLMAMVMVNSMIDVMNYGNSASFLLLFFVYILIFVPGILFMIFSILSIVRQLYYHHPKMLLRRVYRGIRRLGKRMWGSVKEFCQAWLNGSRFEEMPFTKQMFRRQMMYIGVLVAIGFFLFLIALAGLDAAFICSLFIGIPAFIAISLWYMRQQNRNNEELLQLMQQIDEVANGNFDYQPELTSDSMLYATAVRLSGITGGFQKSVEEQVKSERMKIELVTNVSHDLKTPLTSIISYVDLLQKEELPPEAADYVQILAQKSERLKNIVADLFDLAKVTSGEAEIEREVLDMSKLTVQTLADMEDHIEESGLQLKQNIEAPPVPILGDGKKLYRVLQNIIDNALKYSMPGTRVYLDLNVESQAAVLTVKNTAEYEMTFTAEEIMERFTRGDESRTTEGSGLGLSIAKSFTEACGGRFEVVVDGDQFKVQVSFPLTDQPLPETAHDQSQPVLSLSEINA